MSSPAVRSVHVSEQALCVCGLDFFGLQLVVQVHRFQVATNVVSTDNMVSWKIKNHATPSRYGRALSALAGVVV